MPKTLRFEKKSIDTKGTIKTITQDSITYFDTKIFDIAFNYPFILYSRGEIKYLEPNRRKTQNLILTRKYPANELLLKYCKNLEGIIIEASNDPLFERKKRDTLLTLTPTNLSYIAQETTVNKSFRYYRVIGSLCIRHNKQHTKPESTKIRKTYSPPLCKGGGVGKFICCTRNV